MSVRSVFGRLLRTEIYNIVVFCVPSYSVFLCKPKSLEHEESHVFVNRVYETTDPPSRLMSLLVFYHQFLNEVS